MSQFDTHDIERRLMEMDERILRIDFDASRERHIVVAWDPSCYEEYIAFTVPLGQLDARAENDFMKMRSERYSAFDELRTWEAKKERNEERRIEEMSHSMADMLYKPLLRDALGA